MAIGAIVHVVDDDPLICKSIRTVMEAASLSVQVYHSGIDFLDDIAPSQNGCLILDLQLPGMSGVEVLKKLKEIRADIPAIIMSGHVDVPTTVDCMKLGALTVLQKPVDSNQLLEHVRSALAKSLEWQHRHAEKELVRRRLAMLTSREREMLQLVVRGLSNKQIAATCKISVKTVVNHRMHLMTKTHTVNAADLAHFGTLVDNLNAEENP